MHRVWRTLLISSLTLGSVVVAGCGVEAGESASSATTDAPADPKDTSTTTAPEDDTTTTRPDEDDTTTTAPDDEPTPSEQAQIDVTAGLYEEFGLTPEHAECLAESMVDFLNSGGDTTDMGAVMDMMNECDISMEEIADINANMGGGDTESTIQNVLETSFEAAGLTSEQATCVADAYVAEFGTDMAPLQDPTELAPLLDDCDVDPGDLSFD